MFFIPVPHCSSTVTPETVFGQWNVPLLVLVMTRGQYNVSSDITTMLTTLVTLPLQENQTLKMYSHLFCTFYLLTDRNDLQCYKPKNCLLFRLLNNQVYKTYCHIYFTVEDIKLRVLNH